MKIIAKLLPYLITAISVSSCVTSKPVLPPDNSIQKLKIPMSIKSIQIVDSRDSVSMGDDIQLPFILKPNQHIEFYPNLSEVHKSLLSTLIDDNMVKEPGEGFEIQVELLEAIKIFSSTWTSEKEQVKAKVRVTASNGTGRIWSEAQGESFVTSIDAQNAKFEELYKLNLKNVTYKALELLKTYKAPVTDS